MRSLADTNVVSELIRPRPNPGVLAWAANVNRITISVVSIEEIAFGLSWKPARTISDWTKNFIEQACDVLPITSAIAQRSGELRGQLRARGITRSTADMLIAATAQVHGLTLVTRNVRDFDGFRIDVLNPFV
jgi:predicted nucleic acid-binding protein